MVNSCENNNNIVVEPTKTMILQGNKNISRVTIEVLTNGEIMTCIACCCVIDETRSRKVGQEMKRRVLGEINQNLVGARGYPCVVNKRGYLSK